MGETLRPRGSPHPNPSPQGEGLSSRDTSNRTNSPPLQGRGKGWGLPVGRADEIARYARELRNQPTPAEMRLWSILSRRQLDGFKFRRQARIGGSIADFLCPQKGLIVEVDGETHLDAAADVRRTDRLAVFGFRVVRVTNAEVLGNLEGVRTLLSHVLASMPDRRPPHPDPSPQGEGLEGL